MRKKQSAMTDRYQRLINIRIDLNDFERARHEHRIFLIIYNDDSS